MKRMTHVKYRQLPLPFKDGTIDPITCKPSKMPVDASNYPERELALSFKASWFGWFGALLMGHYDGWITPPGYTITNIALCTSRGQWGWYLTARSNTGDTVKASHWEGNRQKAIRSLRLLARTDGLTWKSGN